MGLLDSLLFGMGGGETNSFGIPKTGIAGIDGVFKNLEENQSRPKLGKFCEPTCRSYNTALCESCKERQAALDEKLLALQKLDEAIRSPRPQTPAKPRPVKCAVCGAPFESGARECPYCGAAYPAFDEPSDLPESDYDHEQLYLSQAADTYNTYSAMRQAISDQNLSAVQNKIPGILRGFSDGVFEHVVSMFAPMSQDQIRQGAQQYGVSYYEYVYGAITNKYKSVPYMNSEQRLETMRQQTAESRAAQQEYSARNRQIEQERQAKLRKINQERSARAFNMTAGRAPQYSGGGGGGGGGHSHCCGTCEFYRIYDKSCLANKFRHPSGPNDPACNEYRWLR